MGRAHQLGIEPMTARFLAVALTTKLLGHETKLHADLSNAKPTASRAKQKPTSGALDFARPWSNTHRRAKNKNKAPAPHAPGLVKRPCSRLIRCHPRVLVCYVDCQRPFFVEGMMCKRGKPCGRVAQRCRYFLRRGRHGTCGENPSKLCSD